MMPGATEQAARPGILDKVLSKLWAVYGAKFFRYCGVSAFNVIFGQALLALFYSVLGWEAKLSNVLAVCISAGPAYWFSRHWVWEQQHGSHSVRSEIVPFWGMALLGLLLSTWAVDWADSHFDNSGIAVQLASIASFGVVWVFKFFIIEKLMWKTSHVEAPVEATH